MERCQAYDAVGLVAGALLFLACGDGQSPAQPTPPTAGPIQVFADREREFGSAIAALGTAIVINFDDVDAAPVTDTIQGRRPFDGQRYVRSGFVFASPNGVSLFVAPGGLFWNSSNSLSVGRFPFDPLDPQVEAPFVEDDDLTVTFQPGCSAAGFSIIDNGTSLPDEIVQFLASDELIHESRFPMRFLGVVSTGRPIVRIRISEAAADGDDVTYDDVVCVR